MKSKSIKHLLIFIVFIVIISAITIWSLHLLNNTTESPNKTLIINIIKFGLAFGIGSTFLLAIGQLINGFIQQLNQVDTISKKIQKLADLKKSKI
jgi:hypothetical protein